MMGILKVLRDPKCPQLCPKMAVRGEGGWNPQHRPVTPKSPIVPQSGDGRNGKPQMLWHGPKMAALCPKMAALCPKMAALCPKMAALCPKMAALCPKMAALCPKMAPWCPKMAALCPKMAALCPKMAAALWCSSHEGAFWAQIGHFWLTESSPT